MDEPHVKKFKLQNFSSPHFQLINLPNEVLLKIFGYLSTFDILCNVSLVCKSFKRLSKDKYLIQILKICDTTILTSKTSILKVLKNQSSNLTKLVINRIRHEIRDAPPHEKIETCVLIQDAKQLIEIALQFCQKLIELEIYLYCEVEEVIKTCRDCSTLFSSFSKYGKSLQKLKYVIGNHQQLKLLKYLDKSTSGSLSENLVSITNNFSDLKFLCLEHVSY